MSLRLTIPYQEQQKQLDAAIARFPATFGLRAFPGRTFRIEPAASWFGDNGPVLYVYALDSSGSWLAFSKGSEAELKKEIR